MSSWEVSAIKAMHSMGMRTPYDFVFGDSDDNSKKRKASRKKKNRTSRSMTTTTGDREDTRDKHIRPITPIPLSKEQIRINEFYESHRLRMKQRRANLLKIRGVAFETEQN